MNKISFNLIARGYGIVFPNELVVVKKLRTPLGGLLWTNIHVSIFMFLGEEVKTCYMLDL